MYSSFNFKWISLRLQVLFYLFAGINHFVNPEFYLPLIPPFFESADLFNNLAGVAEIILAIGLAIPSVRQKAKWGIVLMLLAFIPSHIYFIQIGSCVDGGLCVPMWLGWIRLLLIHPLLIGWVISIPRSKIPSSSNGI